MSVLDFGDGPITGNDRNCLSYWFPRLERTGVPVPRTEVIRVDDGENGWTLTAVLEGEEPPAFAPLVASIRAAASRLGYPAFLRTGQGSGKHEWKWTCYLAGPDYVPRHVGALIEWSHMVDMFGLPHGVWCVRQMLPVEPIVVLPTYQDMPLVKEVRAFVRGGRVVCHHPYWPLKAIADGFGCRANGRVDDGIVAYAAAAFPTAADEPHWRPLAERVAAAFADDGAWSVDLLATRDGWYVTDMAEAGRSYHWPGCAEAGGLA